MVLKNTIITAPMLNSPNTSALFYIKANSSDFIIGAMLSQALKEDGKWYLVIFLSKSLSIVEHNYKIYNKKMLVIIYILKEYYHFLKRALALVKI